MYLDNAATTKIHPEVLKEMINAYNENLVNYNALYYDDAIRTKDRINSCYDKVREILNFNDDQEIVFTSGATESNNYILRGIIEKNLDKHFITSSIEHKSILEVFKFYAGKGVDVTFVMPNEKGVIEATAIESEIKENTVLISVMLVNNETGVINEIEDIAKKYNGKILIHVDAVQALGKMYIDFAAYDFISLSAHKIYGPKGIGMAIINKKHKPQPLLMGSSDLRNGTIANELIIGFTKAIEIVLKNVEENIRILEKKESEYIKLMSDNLKIELNFSENKVPGIVSIRIPGQINNIFLQKNKDVLSASIGSSCSITNPSYVLKSIGFSDEMIKETIRISFSIFE